MFDKAVIGMKVGNIKHLFKRRYTLKDVALEIKTEKAMNELDENNMLQTKKKTMFLVFQDTAQRDQAYKNLMELVPKECITTEISIDEYTTKW